MGDNKELENREIKEENVVITTGVKENKLELFLQILFVILFIFGSFWFCNKGFTEQGFIGIAIAFFSIIGSVYTN